MCNWRQVSPVLHIAILILYLRLCYGNLSSYLTPLIDKILLVDERMNIEHWWIDVYMGESKSSEKMFMFHLVHQNPTWTGLGLNPALGGEGPRTDPLSSGTPSEHLTASVNKTFMSFWRHVSRFDPLYSAFSCNILKCCIIQDSTSRYFNRRRGYISTGRQHV
jgi:hypothetical protein